LPKSPPGEWAARLPSAGITAFIVYIFCVRARSACVQTWEDDMKLPRRQFLPLAAGAAALPAASRIERTQAYPSRPVRIGGVNDTWARLFAQATANSLLVLSILVLSTAIEPAHAQKKPKGANPPSSSASAECFKKNGARYDASRNRWILDLGEDGTFRLDAVRKCISAATGAPAGGIQIREVPASRLNQ
jgi:hypothetical protein